jgi:hypothetical protein
VGAVRIRHRPPAGGQETGSPVPGTGPGEAPDLAGPAAAPDLTGPAPAPDRAEPRPAPDLAGRAFAVVTVLPALALIAWLVPGAALLLAGHFLPLPMALISVPLAAVLLLLAIRDTPAAWPAVSRQPARRVAAWWGLAGTAAVSAGFAAWQLLENSPQLIVSRDPGAYLQLGYWIAERGSLPIPASAAAFGGSHPGLTFSSFGFTSHGGALLPQVTAGLPITLAAGLWTHSVPGAAVVSPVLGALAVLSVGGLAGRLAGPQWAPAGALLVAVTVPEIYTSRSAFAETLVQALLFGGLCLVTDSLSARRPRVLAALGGLALGLTALALAGSLLALLPVIAFAGAAAAGRRPQALPFAAGVAAGAGLGLASGFVLAPGAMSITAPPLRIVAIMAAGIAGLTTLIAAMALAGPARHRAQRVLAARPLRWLPEAAAAVTAGLVAAFAVRPYVQTARGSPDRYVGALQRLARLPVDPGRQYSEHSLYWLIWYLGVPALLLGTAGLALAARGCVRALITWRDPRGTARAWALPAALTAWALPAVLWQPGTVPDQPWASRRLVPVLLPGLVVAAVAVAAWLTGRARQHGAGKLARSGAVACFVAALALPPASLTFGVGPWRATTPAVRLALTGLAFQRTGAGEYPAIRSLCGAIPAHSAVLLLDQQAARGFGQAVRGMCGQPAGVMAGASPAEVERVVGAIERSGRRPVLLATRKAELRALAPDARQVVSLGTRQDAHLLTEPPTATWPARYTLWMATAAGIGRGL